MVNTTLEGCYWGVDPQGNAVRVWVYKTGQALVLKRQDFDDHEVHPSSDARREIEIVYALNDLKWVNPDNVSSPVETNNLRNANEAG